MLDEFKSYTTDLTMKEIRNQLGMSQKAFSDTFGIPKRTVENWDMGKISPTDYLVKLIAYLTRKERGE